MAKRSRIKGHYVVRDKKGRFKHWSSVGRSIKRDRRRRSKTRPSKPGRGHRGDYKRKSKKTTYRKKSTAKKTAKRLPGSYTVYKVKGGWRLSKHR